MSTSERSTAARVGRAVWPFVPGVAIFAVLYLATVTRGGRFLYEERFNIMQALEQPALSADPMGSLLSLHSQPPFMNTLYALTDTTPERLGYLIALAALVTVVLVVDAVRACGRSAAWAATAGALYALLPATVLYSLFPYTTTMTALFAMLALWGVCRSGRWPALGVTVSALGMLGLFLVRPSFVWVIALGWLVALAVLLVRRRPGTASVAVGGAALALAALGVVGVQAHYWTSFGIPTLSSWSGENVSNALLKIGLTDDAKARLSAADPCYAQLVATGAWGPIEAYPACVDPSQPAVSGTPVLDLPQKSAPSAGVNLNSGARLSLAEDWGAFARAALAEEPTALWRVVTGNPASEGSLALFLGRSDVYYQTLDLQKASTPWLWHLLGIWSACFPFLAWAIVIAAAVRGIVQRRSRSWLPTPFWFALTLLLLHAVPSVLGEYGENQRFRAEMDAVLMVAMIVGLGALVVVRRVPAEDAP